MQISRRTKFSLTQLLSVVERPTAHVIFDKFGFDPCAVSSPVNISEEIMDADNQILSDLIIEVIETKKTLRNGVSPRLKFDDQFSILEKSLLLDGYLIEEKSIKALDPNFMGFEPVEDALIKEIGDSSLQNKVAIIQSVKASADDFVKAQPDYNGSLTNVRIALETLVREIALEKGFTQTTPNKMWGGSLGYLKNNGFIDKHNEDALSSVYTFISNGSHVPLGFTEAEFVRLGRNMCTSMCYFVIKRYNF
jgi:hypothetical protein